MVIVHSRCISFFSPTTFFLSGTQKGRQGAIPNRSYHHFQRAYCDFPPRIVAFARYFQLFLSENIKRITQTLYQYLRDWMAEAVGFEPTCPLGQPHFECGSLRPLRYASTGADCGKQDDPDDESPCSDGGATRI